MNRMTLDVAKVLDEGDISPDDRKSWLNILKMTTYIASHLTEAFEKQHNKPTIDTLATGKV